jgi:eukaryotic-like serine/threonine-protein kinase
MSHSDPRPLAAGAADRPDPVIARRIAERYVVEDLVAPGGMARVYRARDERLGRQVAVKVLSLPYAEDAAFVQRFLAEARTAASLSHVNLVHVYDSGSDGRLHFIVMELLDRYRSLREELAARGVLAPREVIRLGDELLAGLGEVHRRGLVHCDVKTGNVMLGPGPAKLIDFGIARTPRRTGSGEPFIGSLHYMAPEQLQGGRLTAASDLYALGVVLYEALTGRVPYEGRTPSEVTRSQERPPIPPSRLADGISPRLEGVVLQAVSLQPGRRFESARAMARALKAAEGADDETAAFTAQRQPPRPPVQAREPQRRAHSAHASRRRRWLGVLGPVALMGAAAAIVVLAVMVGTGAFQDAMDREAPAPTATAATPLPEGMVEVPNTIGMNRKEAEAAAVGAGLRWQIRCETVPGAPPEIHDQEPPPGTVVERGSRLTMFSRQFDYCREG